MSALPRYRIDICNRFDADYSSGHWIEPTPADDGKWVKASDVSQLEQENAAAALEIMASLAPLVSDAAIVGKSYGWAEVLGIVKAVADKHAELRQAQEEREDVMRHACADYLDRNYGAEAAEVVEALRTLAWGPLRDLTSPDVPQQEKPKECILDEGLTCRTHDCGVEWVESSGYRCDVSGKVITWQTCVVCGVVWENTFYPQHSCFPAPSVPSPKEAQ